MTTIAGIDRALDRVQRSCDDATNADELLERLSADFHDLVPHDSAVWFGADPATLLITSPTRVEWMDEVHCEPYWDHEFHVPDVAQFVDLARSVEPAAALQLTLGGHPRRSARFREVLEPQGLEDELRGVMRAHGNTWGMMGLYRDAGRGNFDAADVELVKRSSPIIAAALRDHVRARSPWLGVARAPGLVVFDEHSQVISANAEAVHWLDQLVPDQGGIDQFLKEPPPHAVAELLRSDGLDRRISPLWALLARTRAVASGIDDQAARVRLRDRRGQWLVLHGSSLATGRPTGPQSVAVVIEPAKSSEIAPIIIEAYSLTSRERDVVGAVARGESTSEIAASLFLSPHTVRDHIKTVFEKVSVSSRAELVAKLYAEHYCDQIHAELVHVN